MRRAKLLAAAALLATVIGCARAKPELTGEVFIVTNGAQNIKLGGLQVSAIPESVMSPHITTKYAQVIEQVKVARERAINSARGTSEYKTAFDELMNVRAGAPYFDDMPKAAAGAVTDSDGKFSMVLPATGTYILAAQGRRQVAMETENYYWLMTVKVDDAKGMKVILTNANQTLSKPTDTAMPELPKLPGE